MADGDPHASIAPFQRYYLLIDGTGAADSVEYGRLLEEKFGFRNLLTEFLEPDPNASKGEERLVDPNHLFLPICTFPAAGRKKTIAVVCPGGRDGKGLDAFWANFQGGDPGDGPNAQFTFVPPLTSRPVTTFGRQTAALKAGFFMRELILVPAIEKVTKQGKSFAQIKQGLLSGSQNPTEPDVPAELIIVSSHGWLSGFMKGDELKESKVAEPPEVRKSFFVPHYFIVGAAAADRRFFFGPKWIILAQCSTVNAATWVSWVRLMMNGIPKVRGILAYEEVSPGVFGSIDIARDFVDRLGQGQTILRAWRGANKDQKWAALLHKKAVGDVMSNWDRFEPVTEAELTATTSTYLAFGASLERGADKPADGAGLVDFPAKTVLDVPPPFGLTVESARPKANPPRPFQEITEATQGQPHADLVEDMEVRTTITPPPNAKIAAATLRWVHLRESRRPQVPIANIFSSFTADPAGLFQLAVSDKEPRTDRNTLNIQPTAGPVDRIVILWTVHAKAVLARSGLEPDHSLVWPLVAIDVVGGAKAKEAFPFTTKGLLF